MLLRAVRIAGERGGEERTSEVAPGAPEDVEKGEAGLRVSGAYLETRRRTHLGTMGTMAKGKVRGAPLRHEKRVNFGPACSRARPTHTRHLTIALLWWGSRCAS